MLPEATPQLTGSEKHLGYKPIRRTQMKYNELNLGQIEAIINKLGGIDGVQRFLSGEMVVSAATKVWKIWKTIKLGTGPKNADDFRKAIKQSGMYIGDWGNDILGKPAFTAATEETEVDLVLVTVTDLGFKEGAKRSDIYNRAIELGLQLCPNEVGPQLRLQYKDQPKGEWLLVGMEPITDSDGDLEVFRVGRSDDGELCLGGSSGDPDDFWYGGYRFVFVLPRK